MDISEDAKALYEWTDGKSGKPWSDMSMEERAYYLRAAAAARKFCCGDVAPENDEDSGATSPFGSRASLPGLQTQSAHVVASSISYATERIRREMRVAAIGLVAALLGLALILLAMGLT